jgi:hypothetical protein
MVKQRMTLAMVAMLVLLSAVAASAQAARIEGIVARSSKEKSTLTVRARSSTSYDEKLVHYDSSTHFTAQAHGDKDMKEIDASQIKDGDRVICLGAYNEKKEFVAAFISKRQSQ